MLKIKHKNYLPTQAWDVNAKLCATLFDSCSACEVVAAIKILFLSSFKQVLKYVERKRRCSASVAPAVWYIFIDAIVNTTMRRVTKQTIYQTGEEVDTL